MLRACHRATDPAMLDGLEKGDDARFHIVMDDTNMIIEELEAQ